MLIDFAMQSSIKIHTPNYSSLLYSLPVIVHALQTVTERWKLILSIHTPTHTPVFRPTKLLQGVKLNGCPLGLYLAYSRVLLSILTLFTFYFRRSSRIFVFAVIDWVLAFVFFNMSSPAHFTIPAVHSLTLFACVCSRRWASVNTVTQKEAAQRRHAEFTKLLAQNDEVRHWFRDAPYSLQKQREGEAGRRVLGWWESEECRRRKKVRRKRERGPF